MLSELIHLLLSLTTGLIFYLVYRKWSVFLWAIIGGFLVDMDHLIDYFLWKRSLSFNLGEFMAGDQFTGSGKLYIFLHSYEWVVLTWAILLIVSLRGVKRRGNLIQRLSSFVILRRCFSVILSRQPKDLVQRTALWQVALLAVSFSLFFHLGFDIVHNRTGFGTYLLTNRVIHSFNLSNFCFGG